METRFQYSQAAPGVYQAMASLDDYVADCGIDKTLLYLVQLRASQLNGCAYCIDMHWRDLRALGESEQRLYGLSTWRESAAYTEKERAALAWTEAVTAISEGQAPDGVYEAARLHFGKKAIADLTLAIAAINAWNRLSIAARLRPEAHSEQRV